MKKYFKCQQNGSSNDEHKKNSSNMEIKIVQMNKKSANKNSFLNG